MSAAVAESVDAPPKTRRFRFRFSKKLLLIVLGGVLLLAAAGGGIAIVLKKRAAAAAEAGDGGAAAAEPAEVVSTVQKPEHRKPPTFVPLDTFTVNLADKEAERFAQVGVTLELDDPKVAEELRNYMPPIRNGILMILAHKNSAELLDRNGKQQLAVEIGREAMRSMGYELPPAAQGTSTLPPDGPVKQVHFSSFIIQ